MKNEKPSKSILSKKARILARWEEGAHNIWQLAGEFGSKPSYVASVLQAEGKIQGYTDLYTSPRSPVNVYSGLFRGRLGYRDLGAAQRSADWLSSSYAELGAIRDRAGQHHCMVVALTLFNRARFLGKNAEAAIFGDWLRARLAETDSLNLAETG